MASATSVPKLYYSVIEEVVSSVRDAFIDEGVDEQTLAELRQLWEKKLVESKAIEREPEVPPAPTRVMVNHNLLTSQPQTSHVISSAPNVQMAVGPSLGIPNSNILPQQLHLQYSTTTADGQKTLVNLPQKLTLTMPAQAGLQSLAQTGLQSLVSTSGTMQFPPELASLLQGNQQLSVPFQTLTSDQLQKSQQYVAIPVSTTQGQATGLMGQIDGANDTSDEEDDIEFNDNDDDAENDDDDVNEDEAGEGEDEDPLNSNDDVSDEDPSDLFDTENVIVCQYDKVTRSKNRWKFHLKDGIMNLKGKDFVFQKALGDSEW